MRIVQEPRVTFKNHRDRKLKAVGINVYGGGFTIGVLRHFHVLAQLEEFKLGRRSFLLNFPNVDSPFCEPKDWPLERYVDETDLVYANPPCVPWSHASSYSARTGQIGTRKGKTIADRFRDPLLKLTDNTMRAGIKIRPRVFISESVEQAFNTGVRHYDQYVRAWNRAGYHVTFFLTDAVIHGAPCRRRRFHFIAHDVPLLLGAPPRMEGFEATTVRDAIGDLRRRAQRDDGEFQHFESNAGRWCLPSLRRFLKSCPPMKILRQHIEAVSSLESLRRRGLPMPSSFCRKLSWDIPAPTMMGFNKLIHPDGERWITYREGLRLMTYPDEFRIAGRSDVDAYDAVIPLVGEMLARAAKRSIEAGGRAKPGHTVVDWRPLGVGLSGRAALKEAA